MLKFVVRSRPRYMSATLGLGGGPSARLERLRRTVTAVVRYERIESYYHRLDEARGYTERLLQLAIKNGPKDPKTMEMADYWLLEKDLVLKLFKVLVPRYSNYSTSFTDMYKLPTVYPGKDGALGILELKGNPWPPVLPDHKSKDQYLINQLLEAARENSGSRSSLHMDETQHFPPTDQIINENSESDSLIQNFDQINIQTTENSNK
ncbi:39S ribosomal protein L17, mitochondrial [Octopus bimaculoides]|uniref:Large ribosomal subunit protein bL17m n=1 Tax=Octopus bimaculoides TaxID=37653 RepID=A0A0L8HQT3_OCTBM|nr:39S ribosomal protein L17, mitochondrial [Octopus bimaculoides]|eukprot:XP_014770333.1 PREDICTED: 39S ribosomal protein L17, mitochondrial-like [Octopus bimaculoides]